MDNSTLSLPGLSPVAGRPVKACFDGGTLSSNAGVLVLREVKGRLGGTGLSEPSLDIADRIFEMDALDVTLRPKQCFVRLDRKVDTTLDRIVVRRWFLLGVVPNTLPFDVLDDLQELDLRVVPKAIRPGHH